MNQGPYSIGGTPWPGMGANGDGTRMHKLRANWDGGGRLTRAEYEELRELEDRFYGRSG